MRWFLLQLYWPLQELFVLLLSVSVKKKKKKSKQCHFSFTCKTSRDFTTALQYLVVFSIKLRDNSNERESHNGHECEFPGHLEHEDEEAGALDDAPQEDVNILGDEITNLGSVS